jgi:hypothetical protein
MVDLEGARNERARGRADRTRASVELIRATP